MIKTVEVKEGVLLKDYDLYSSLAMALRELTIESSKLLPKIKGKKIWMISSTAQGGGVAEMMPRIVSLLRQLGIECDWIIASTDKICQVKDGLMQVVDNFMYNEPGCNELENSLLLNFISIQYVSAYK